MHYNFYMKEKKYVLEQLGQGKDPETIYKKIPEGLSGSTVKSLLETYPSLDVLKKLGKLPQAILGIHIFFFLVKISSGVVGLTRDDSQKGYLIGEIVKSAGSFAFMYFVFFRYLLQGHRKTFKFLFIVDLIVFFYILFSIITVEGRFTPEVTKIFLTYSYLSLGICFCAASLCFYTLKFKWKKIKLKTIIDKEQ